MKKEFLELKTLKTAQKGMYIINGHKVVIK